MNDPITELEKLESRRERLHDYIIMKLEKEDYHAVADGAMDLRETDMRVKTILELYPMKGS